MEREHPDIQVVTTKLSDRVQGCVDRRRRIIWINEGLTAVQARCTLAYEVAVLQGGPTSADVRLAVMHERAAAEWAAMMLIDSDALLFALRLSSDLPAIAEHLGVDVATLRTRLRCLTDTEQDSWMEATASTGR